MDVTWTIGELAERAVAVLAAGESAQVNGRVRDLPNERLIRWYTTIGLVDPPAGRRGRTALYGPRHLLQLVAVKRRQAAGRSIAEIQLELAAATDATLERIAALPPGAMDSAAEVPSPAAGATAAGSTPDKEAAATEAADTEAADTEAADTETADSARQPTRPRPEAAPTDDTATPRAASAETGSPADGAQQVDSGRRTDDARQSDSAQQSRGAQQAGGEARIRERFWSARPDMSFGRATVAADYARPVLPVVQGVRLAPDLTLLLEAGSLSADDLRAIETAARPLLDELAARGLIASPADSTRPPADPPRRPQ